MKDHDLKIGDCSCCNVENIEVSTYNLRFQGSKSLGGQDVDLCRLCAYSFISCAYQYPNQADISELARSLGAVGNMIIQEINRPKTAVEEAAFDLLRALKEIIKLGDEGYSNAIVGRADDGHPLDIMGVARKNARVAISKAEQQ